jgi:hypothetical protein
VHDRRIDGQAHIFGNAGSLFMNAMTWYDHETKSTWSQPWGRALDGELKGVELFLLPSQISTWASWKKAHPNTLAMTSDISRVGSRERFDPDFVIGLLLAEKAKAYYYRDVAAEMILNDMLGAIPIFLWAADELYYAYVRQIDDQMLTFQIEDGILTDLETGSTWDIDLGLATKGPLAGESLQPVPSSSAYDWAWSDFYPESEIYQP